MIAWLQQLLLPSPSSRRYHRIRRRRRRLCNMTLLQASVPQWNGQRLGGRAEISTGARRRWRRARPGLSGAVERHAGHSTQDGGSTTFGSTATKARREAPRYYHHHQLQLVRGQLLTGVPCHHHHQQLQLAWGRPPIASVGGDVEVQLRGQLACIGPFALRPRGHCWCWKSWPSQQRCTFPSAV